MDGVPCGYFSEMDEAWSNPEESQARKARHEKHLRHGPSPSRFPKYAPALDEPVDPPHGWPGPGDAPVVADGGPDMLDEAQAVSFALARLSVLTWTLSRWPSEMGGPLRLLIRALQHGCVPTDEWFQALEQFCPPAPPDWGLR